MEPSFREQIEAYLDGVHVHSRRHKTLSLRSLHQYLKDFYQQIYQRKAELGAYSEEITEGLESNSIRETQEAETS